MSDEADDLRAAMRISCADATMLFTDFDDGALSPADNDRVRAHLSWCQACRVFLEQLRTTAATLGAVGRTQRSSSADAPIDTLLELLRRSGGTTA